MATGMEFVSSLIILYMEFERLYLGRPSVLTNQLKDALCSLYPLYLCTEYLAMMRAKHKYTSESEVRVSSSFSILRVFLANLHEGRSENYVLSDIQVA
jgi:hypothetical protein